MFSGGLREAARSVHVSYPVPFLTSLLLVSGVSVIGLARFFTGPDVTLLLWLAGGLFALAGSIVIKAVFFSPALLRSERYEIFHRIVAAVGDNEMDPRARERLQMRLIRSLSEGRSDRPTSLGTPEETDAGKDDGG